MAANLEVINIAGNPAMKEIVEQVSRTGQPKVLRDEETGAEVEVRPSARKRTRSRGGEPTSPDDPFWSLIGIGASGRRDLSTNHDKYLAAAKASKRR